MKNSKVLVVVILTSFVLGGLFIYKSSRNSASDRNTRQNVSSTSNTTPPLSENTVAIKGFNYGFSPNTISVKQGDMVMLELVSDDSPHTFTIDELGVNQQFTWGKDADLSFVADKKGIFEFYCAVPGHKENGMVGTLLVN